MATTWNEMPADIKINILSRLRVKSLMRFRCVCKSWHTLIADPYFINTHLNRSRANRKGYVLVNHPSVCSSYLDKFSLYCDETFVEHTRLEVPFENLFKNSYIMGHCDGLFCIYSLRTHRGKPGIYLWNPAVQMLKALPDPIKFVSHIAFCFVPQTNDYRVAQFIWVGGYRLRVLIFSLRTDSWKEIQNVIQCQLRNHTKYSILNGVVHCVACRPTEGNEYYFIFSFDLANEVFGEIELPEYARRHDNNMPSMFVAVVMESLCLFVSFSGSFDIWVMKEYGETESWTKQFTIIRVVGYVLYPIGLMKNGEVVLRVDYGKLASCDPRAQQYKDLLIPEIPRFLNDFTYSTESLLLLN